MPPKDTAPPPHIDEVFRREFDNLARPDILNRQELKTAALAGIPTFTLTLSDVLTRHLDGEPTGWRLLVGGPEGTQASEPTLADVSTGGRDGQPRLVSFSQNPQVAEFYRRYKNILAAEQLIVEQGFQLRFLRIPGVITEAFWLRSPDGRRDIVVPIRAPAGLNKEQQYSLDEFLVALQPVVGKFLAFDKETV